MTSTPTPTAGDADVREVVARLIEPDIFTSLDSQAGFPPESLERYQNRKVNEAFAKADAILAALRSTQDGGGASASVGQMAGACVPANWSDHPSKVATPDLEAILTGYENMGPEGDSAAAVEHLCRLMRHLASPPPVSSDCGGAEIASAELMGLHEVAEFLGMTKQAVFARKVRNKLPKPEAELQMGPIWTAESIRAYAKTEARHDG